MKEFFANFFELGRILSEQKEHINKSSGTKLNTKINVNINIK